MTLLKLVWEHFIQVTAHITKICLDLSLLEGFGIADRYLLDIRGRELFPDALIVMKFRIFLKKKTKQTNNKKHYLYTIILSHADNFER